MVPTALSQIIEALGKLLLGLTLAIWGMREGYSVAMSAAFATAGITVGVGLSMLYLLIAKLCFKPREIKKSDISEIDSSKTIIFTLVKIAVPITLSSLVISLTRVVDLVMIMRRL